jgi:7-cyano-7-deazaguanine synthase in queuosine biosynthesis
VSTVFVRAYLGQCPPARADLVVGPIHEKASCGFQHTLDRLLCRPNPPQDNVQAFATVAIAVFLADKMFSRPNTEDRWTREIALNVPAGSFGAALQSMTEVLQYLSGDAWTIHGRLDTPRIGARTYYKDPFSPDTVCLLSGGTDSLVGSINALEDGKKLLLVSHFESTIDARVQNSLVRELQRAYGAENVRHRSVKLCAATAVEKSARTRSLLYIALAMLAASAFCDDLTVLIPENGFIGLNVPLTGARIGTYSTRTTHPAFLQGLHDVLGRLSIRHPIVNPLGMHSKGQTLATCTNQSLLLRLLPLTVSCAKGNPGRYRGRNARNCGYCYPCLIRRSAFHVIGVDDAHQYLDDAIGQPTILQEEVRGRDLRALLQGVRAYRQGRRALLTALLKTGPIQPAVISIDTALATVATGLEEVANFVRDKGCRTVKRFA